MAASVYRIDRQQTLGNQLLTLLERISSDFAQVKSLRLAMIQQQEAPGDEDSDFLLMASMFGYLTDAGQPDTTGAVAHASFQEIDAFVNSAAPSLEQCCARHRQ